MADKVKEPKKPLIILSIGQAIAVGSFIVGLLGSIYGAGIWTETEAKKMALIKQEQELTLKFKDEISDIKTKYRLVNEDMIFYKQQYVSTNTRLTKCIERQTMYRIGESLFENEKEDKEMFSEAPKNKVKKVEKRGTVK